MPAASATPEQIKSYEETVARAWGGRDKLGTLFASSPDYHLAFIDAVYGRYQGALDLLVPWVRRLVPDIAVRRLFEVGCGTGSSTAAFATICEQVTAFDVAERDVVLARERLTHFAAIGSTADACDFPEILRRLDFGRPRGWCSFICGPRAYVCVGAHRCPQAGMGKTSPRRDNCDLRNAQQAFLFRSSHVSSTVHEHASARVGQALGRHLHEPGDTRSDRGYPIRRLSGAQGQVRPHGAEWAELSRVRNSDRHQRASMRHLRRVRSGDKSHQRPLSFGT